MGIHHRRSGSSGGSGGAGGGAAFGSYHSRDSSFGIVNKPVNWDNNPNGAGGMLS